MFSLKLFLEENKKRNLMKLEFMIVVLTLLVEGVLILLIRKIGEKNLYSINEIRNLKIHDGFGKK